MAVLAVDPAARAACPRGRLAGGAATSAGPRRRAAWPRGRGAGVRAGAARRGRRTRARFDAGGLLRADALSAWLLLTIGAVAVTALWGGLPEPRRRSSRLGRPVRRAGVPVPGRHEPGRARRQPRRAVGGGRGHHHRHRVPGRPPRQRGGRWRRRGSTSCSARSGSRSRSSGSCCSTPRRSPPARPPCPGRGSPTGGIAAGPGPDPDRGRAGGAGLRHQGRPRADAQLAARRPLARRPRRSPG